MTIRNQSGFNLVEILVSLLLASIGVVGFLTLFLQMNTSELETQQREEASRIANLIVGQMRANRYALGCYQTDVFLAPTGYVGVGYDPATTPYNCAGFGDNSTRAQAEADIVLWHSTLVGSLVTIDDGAGNDINVGGIQNARGCIGVDTDPNYPDRYIVEVAWQSLTPGTDRVGGCAEDLYFAPDAAAGDAADDRYRRVLRLAVEIPELL